MARKSAAAKSTNSAKSKAPSSPRRNKPAPVALEVGQDDELERKADDYVRQLIEVRPEDTDARESKKASVETMGFDLQSQAAKRMDFLKEPIKKLSTRSEEGGDVAQALINLKNEVEELDPAKFDFKPGWFTRTVGRLPGVGTPLKRYFSKYETAQSVIASIIQSLEQGKEQLKRDNLTLSEDQSQIREMTYKLDKAIRLAQLMDQKLQYQLDREIPKDDPRHAFISEELLFPLRQRIIDLQQQQAVNQQGVLATEVIIRNNKELIRGVDRSLSVTVTALQVGATVALALAHQRIVLDKVSSVNRTTSDLIAGTAARLRTQGVEIHKQASDAQLDMDALRSAFADIRAALADLSDYRMSALPQMSQTIQELDQVTFEAGRAIQDMEHGNLKRPEITIEVE